jgi:hypothetical protein
MELDWRETAPPLELELHPLNVVAVMDTLPVAVELYGVHSEDESARNRVSIQWIMYRIQMVSELLKRLDRYSATALRFYFSFLGLFHTFDESTAA